MIRNKSIRKQESKLRLFLLLFFITNILISSALSALAFSNCQVKYDSDKRSLPSLRGMCNVCHISPNGAGPQNEFGMAFANAGFMITDELVKQFSELFQKPKEESPPSTASSSGESINNTSNEPSIKRIKPKTIKTNKESMITIIGMNFVEGAKAFVDNNEVATTFKSNVKLVIDLILNTMGLHELKVQNPDGHESNSVNVKAK